MSHLYWLHEAHLKRIQHLFSKPRGVAQVSDRCVLSGIIHVIRNGLRWRDAPSDCGPHKTLYNRWARWSHMCVFARILTMIAYAFLQHRRLSQADREKKKHRRTASAKHAGRATRRHRRAHAKAAARAMSTLSHPNTMEKMEKMSKLPK